MKRFGVRPSVSAGMNPQQQTRLLRHVPIFAYQKTGKIQCCMMAKVCAAAMRPVTVISVAARLSRDRQS